ncbi:response regulator [Desulfoferrobacter suflitae]|uniref:response regulator n=1 Tax=Desulfoferrobacter suflitae TaxID=2865782 RepID=UPI0021640C90|nr:response regulator [Desulfoferrobacter suflitae]MCK8603145.1 response regulator [Desulfoferrobacter suflitae]
MVDQTILVVEDEQKISALLRDYLQGAGYKTSHLERGDEVPGYVRRNHPDLILLDVMLPGMDGMEVCREVRKFSNVSIIMITARVEEIDRLIGLELGADDYICKPFSPREVVARVKAVLRRVRAEPAEDYIRIGPISLNMETRQVTVDGQALELTPSEFGLLKVLMGHPNRVFSRNELLNQVQGYDFEGYDRTIDTHVKNLRKKINEKLPNQEFIVTVYGVGYKLAVPDV